MNLDSIIQTDLQTIETDLGSNTITWGGETFVVTPSSEVTEAELGSGGFALSVDRVVSVRKSLFTGGVYPEEQDRLEYDGTTYRIEKVLENVTKSFLKLYLITPDKGL